VLWSLALETILVRPKRDCCLELMWWLAIEFNGCSLAGVGVNILLQRTGNQWLHGLLGTPLLINELEAGYVCYLCKEKPRSESVATEETPLVRSGNV